MAGTWHKQSPRWCPRLALASENRINICHIVIAHSAVLDKRTFRQTDQLTKSFDKSVVADEMVFDEVALDKLMHTDNDILAIIEKE